MQFSSFPAFSESTFSVISQKSWIDLQYEIRCIDIMKVHFHYLNTNHSYILNNFNSFYFNNFNSCYSILRFIFL